MENIIEKYFKHKNYFLVCPKTYSYGGVFESLYLSFKISKYQGKKIILCVPFLRFHKKQKKRRIFGIPIIKQIFIHLSFKEKLYCVLSSIIINFNLLLKILKIRGIISIIIGRKFVEKYIPIIVGFDGLYEDLKKNEKFLGKLSEWKNIIETKIDFKKFVNKHDKPSIKKKLVCFYIKDENYHQISEITLSAASEISYCEKTLNYFIDKNCEIIRVGDELSAKFNFSNQNYFDLTTSKKLNQQSQLETFEKSEFYFGSGASATLICNFFEKKRLLINIPPASLSDQTFSFDKNNFIIFKKVFCRKKRKILSLEEIMLTEDLFITEISDLINPRLTSNFDLSKKYVLIENNAEEIYDAAKEFYEFNYGNKKIESSEMKKFKEIRSSSIKNLITKSNKYLNYPSISLFHNTKVSIPKNYLSKYLFNSEKLKEETKEFLVKNKL